MPSDHTHSHGELRLMLLVIGLGFVVRLFSFHYTVMINPDATLYIHQARAIHYGLWDAVNSCNLHFLSIYSILIAGAYQVVGDWIMAGKIVSITFGTLTLIPLCLLTRRFFDTKISTCVILIFALTPIFIHRSVDVVRDPVCWFFLVLGLYFFIIQTDKYHPVYLLLSCLSFLVATWARIEAFVCIPVSLCFILLAVKDRKIRSLALFALPLVIILSLVTIGHLMHDGDALRYFRFSDIPATLKASFIQYEEIRSDLRELSAHPPLGIRPGFFDNIKTILWLVGLGVLIQHAMEAFFYPFFMFFVIGVASGWRKVKHSKGHMYLAFMCATAVLLLYISLFSNWCMENRYLALLIYPSCVFIGIGIEKTITFFQSKFQWKEYTAFAVIVVIIMTFGLGKNLKVREEDKLVFRQIGEYIAQIDGKTSESNVFTADDSTFWISFFSNIHVEGAPCPAQYRHWQNLIGTNYDTFLRTLRKHDVHYFVWVEARWPRDRFDFLANRRSEDFRQMHSWHHWDTGRIILFQVLPDIGGKS